MRLKVLDGRRILGMLQTHGGEGFFAKLVQPNQSYNIGVS
jgi:hypothetical protein